MGWGRVSIIATLAPVGKPVSWARVSIIIGIIHPTGLRVVGFSGQKIFLG